MPSKSSLKLNNSLPFKRRERMMLPENLLPLLPERHKKKLTASHGELNTKTILPTELKKSASSDKSKRSLPPSSKVPQAILRTESVHEKIDF
jgi:hypothetical protein